MIKECSSKTLVKQLCCRNRSYVASQHKVETALKKFQLMFTLTKGEIKWRRVKVSGLSNRCRGKWDKKAYEEQPLYLKDSGDISASLFASEVEEKEKNSLCEEKCLVMEERSMS